MGKGKESFQHQQCSLQEGAGDGPTAVSSPGPPHRERGALLSHCEIREQGYYCFTRTFGLIPGVVMRLSFYLPSKPGLKATINTKLH